MDARLFVALWPTPAVRAQLAARRERWHWPRAATPVASGRLHLTLHFIGSVPATRVDAIGAALQIPFSPFMLRFGHDALWPHGVAVLEPDSAPDALIDLQHALGARLRALSIDTDARSYRPHVTLARRAAGTPVPPAGEADEAIDWHIDHYALVRSQPGGYDVVRVYPA